jgi:glycosyltransferase involved in cell wall biosynthesis
LCQPKNPESLAQKIEKLIELKNDWPSMAQFSREYAQKHFDEKDIILLYIKKIQEFLGESTS